MPPFNRGRGELSGRRAVFLDRDGVLIREEDYLSAPDRLRLLSGAAAAVKRLRAGGFKVIVVTNQSGVGRGFFSIKTLAAIHRRLRTELGRSGARLDALYFCPHLPRDLMERPCSCRKPEIGMIERASRRFGLDLRRSYMVGDSSTDVLAARRARMTGLLVRTGYGGRDGRCRAKPFKTFRNLSAAAAWILKIDQKEGRK